MQRYPIITIVVLALTTVALAKTSAAAQQESTAPRTLHAGSQQEFADYQADSALNSGAQLEQAASSFADHYPESELRAHLFERALHAYQQENNAAGVLKMGESILAIDPSHAIALVLTATVLADSLGPGDPDRDKKIPEIKRNAARALQTLDTSFVAPASATPAQAAIYKTTLQSMAYSALGIANLKTGDYADAEKNLRIAADLANIHPDPYIWYHLALAQDHRRRYAAALNSVEQAMQLASSNPDLQKLAETEHQRLNRLAGHPRESTDFGGTQPPQ